jgi:hypothetical protein
LLSLSAMISQLRFTPHNCVSFALHTERSLRRIGWKYHANPAQMMTTNSTHVGNASYA